MSKPTCYGTSETPSPARMPLVSAAFGSHNGEVWARAEAKRRILHFAEWLYIQPSKPDYKLGKIAHGAALACPCCGASMAANYPARHAATLDCTDPSKGYVLGNVAWLCLKCNMRKQDSTPAILRQLADYIEAA